MTLRKHHQMALAAACAVVAAAAAASEPVPSAVLALRQGGAVSCEPALPYFCENMHVQCAGRTTLATFAFSLRPASDGQGVALVAPDEENQRRYDGARTEWAADGSHLVLSPREANGYVKLQADGRYALRHYIQGRGVMSLGRCT